MTEPIRELQLTLKDDPSNREVFDKLADRYAQEGDWRRLRWHFEKFAAHLDGASDFSQLVFVLRELAEAEDDPKECSAILVALGDVLFEHVDNHEEGMDAYQRAFKTYPADTTSLDRARRVYREAGQFKRVLLLYDLERRVKEGGEHEADVLVHIAQVHGDYLGDHDTALEMLDEVLEHDADHELAATVKEIYEAGGSVASAVKDKVREAHEVAGHGDESAASEMMMQAAALERNREGGGLREAAELAEKARGFEPSNFEAGQFLMEVYEELEQRDELAELTDALEEQEKEEQEKEEQEKEEQEKEEQEKEEQEKEEQEKEEQEKEEQEKEEQEKEEQEKEEEGAEEDQAEGGLDEGSLAADGGQVEPVVEQVASFDGSFEQARQVLDDDPANLVALKAVTSTLREEGALDEVVEQLEDSLKHLRKKDGELDVMVELASTYWEEFGDLDKAEYYCKRIKLLDNEHPVMLAFYEEYYRTEGEWRKLFALLSSQEADDAEEALDLASRLARIAETQMDSPEKAIDVWKNFMRKWDDVPQAREQLRRLYEENAKWNALVDFLKERVRHLAEDGEQTGSARVVLLERIADIYRDELGLDVMVINTLNSILELEPDHRPAFAELKEMLQEARRWNDLAGLLSGRAELELDQDNEHDAVEMLLEVADIWQESLRNVTQALPYLERVVEIAPDNDSVRDRLREIYEQRRDYESLFDLQYAEAKLHEAVEREQRLEELLELAEERLRDPDRSVRILTDLLELRGDDADIFDKLEFIHRRRDDFGALAALLETKAQTTEGDERRALLAEAATLLAEELGEVEESARLWEELLDVDADDEEALEHLTAIYVESEQFDDLHRIYERRDAVGVECGLLEEAAAQAGDERAMRLYRRAAEVAAEDLDDRRRAIDNLEALRELVDDPRQVAGELDAHYTELGDLDGRVASNRVLLAHADDDEQRFELLVRLGGLELQRSEPMEALDMLLQAATLRPDEAAVLDQCEQAARESESVGLFCEHLEMIAQEVADDELRAELWARLGRVLRDDQQNYEGALDFFEKLRERDPEDLDVLDALEGLYEEVDRPQQRIEVLREQIDLLSAQGAERRDLVDQLSKIADVQRTHLGEADSARRTYNEILDLEPDHVGALRGIRQLYRQEDRWAEVVDSLHRELSLLPLDADAQRIDALMELADTLRLETGELREAIHNYGQVLAERPQHEEAVAAVEELLGEPELAREAALMLEPIFRDTDRPAQLARALQARSQVASDRFEEAEILDELIPLYADRLEDHERAFEHACRQFELDPGREEVWLRVEQLGAKLDRWADVERIFSEHAPDGEDLSPGRVNLLRHLASIREHQLGKQEQALQTWEQLHRVEPSDGSVVEALERLYRALGRQDDLVEALEAKESLLDNDAARIDVLAEIAQLCDTVLEDELRTIDAYQRILLLEADHGEAVDELVRLYRADEQWHELDELFVTQADLAVDPDRRRRFLLGLGRLRAEELGDYAGAVDLLSQLVTEDPGDDEALEALQALDARLAELGDRVELRIDLARTLEPAYRARQDTAHLAEVLETRASRTHEPFEKVALLDELYNLYLDKLDAPGEAFSALQRAVAVDPDDEGRRRRLLELGGRLERLDETADALEEAVLAADPMSAGTILRQLGGLYEDVLHQSDEAIDAFERALERDESDEDALGALERLYQNTKSFEKLADNLRRQVRFGDPARRNTLLERAGTLYEEVLDRPEEAIDTYVELLDEDPDSAEAYAALQRLYRGLERWIDLADILRRRAEATYEEQERVDALETLAEVHADKLHDVHEAVSVHREILAVDPTRVATLDALEEIFADEAQWHELADVLRTKLTMVDFDTEQRNRVELQLAAVLREQLFEVDEALGLYRSVLERTAAEPTAIAALEELVEDENYAARVTADLVNHYQHEKADARLVELYRTRLGQSYDPGEKAEFYEKIAHIERDHREAFDSAIDALAEAWKLEPTRDALRNQLLALVERTESHQRLAEIYEEQLTVVSEPEAMLELRLGLAVLYEELLEDALEAETNYREALALDETHEAAYEALERILIDNERWLDLVDVLERRFNALIADDEVQARQILARVATIQEEALQDGFSAAETYRRVLDLEPSDDTANQALSRLYRGQQRWQDLAEHLRRRLGSVSDPQEAIALKQQLADVQRRELLEPHAALHLYREILDLDPDHQPAVEALEAMFDAEDDLRADVAESLEPIYRREAAFGSLVDVLEVRAQACASADEAVEFLNEAAQITEEHLDDLPLAIKILGRVFDRAPDDVSARRQLHRLQAQVGDWQQMAERYTDVLQNNFEVDDELRVELLVEQGEVYEGRLDDMEQARRCYAEVLMYDTANARAVDGLERVLVRTENWLDLVDFYRDRADAAVDPEDSRDWLERLATLYEEVLDDLDEAIAVYIRLYEIDPDDQRYQATLARLYGHAHRFHDLADLYRRRIEQTFEPEQIMELRFRLAGLLESELDMVGDALQIYRDILADAPGHFETMRALDGLRRDLGNREGDFDEYRRQIIELLLEHYNEQNHWRRIVDLLEEKQELVGDVAGQVDALANMADVLERSASDEADQMRSLVKLARAYCIDPRNDNLKDRVHQRANQLEAWERVIPILLEGLSTTDEPEVQSAILRAVADAYAGPLEDTESAITAYQQSVELDGDPRALSRLQHLYGELELWEPLVGVLERRLEDEYDGESRQGLLKRIAMIYDEILDRPEQAVNAYEDLREEDPSEATVLSALARLYEQTERWVDLEEALQSLSEVTDDEDERVDVLRKLARVRDHELDAATEAISTYQQVLAADEEDLDAVRALSRLFEASARWSELLDNLSIERDFAAGLDELNDIEMRMAIVRMDKLEAPMDALDHLESIVERDPSHPDARQALVELVETPETRQRAAGLVQRVYRDQEQWEKLQSLYEKQLDVVDDPERRAEIYMELAQLQEEQFATPQMAFITLGRAFRELAKVSYLRHELERMSRSLDNTDELVAVYEDTLEVAPLGVDTELELRKRVGQLYAEQLEAFDAAIEHFELAYGLDEYDRDTLDWLDRLYQHANRWRDLAEVLETRLSVSEPDQINDVRFRLAYLREVIFEERREALDLYREIVLEEPDHGGAIEGLGRMIEDVEIRREVCDLLEPIYKDLQASEALSNLYELKLEVADSSAERAELHRQIAALQIEQLDSIYAGYAHLGRALREDPHDISVQQRLEALAGEHQLHDQIVVLYEEIIDELDDPVRLVELACAAAGWAYEVLDEPERASKLYRIVLDIEPEHDEAIESLETIARQEDQPQALEAVLSRKADAIFDPDERKDVLVELGQVRMRLELFGEAIAAFREALHVDEGDVAILQQLVALYEITERYDELVETLDRLAQFIEDPDERRMIYVRIGQYNRHFLERPEPAIEAYRQADNLERDRADVLEALEELFAETQQWHNLLEIVERQIEQLDLAEEDDPDERVRLYVARARVHYEHFGDTEGAIVDYQRAFAIRQDSPKVVEALDELYRAEGRWDDVMELYRQQLQLAADEDRLVELHVEMADICQGHLGEDTRAYELIETVLELRPHHERALDVMQTMYERRQEWGPVAEVIKLKAEGCSGDHKVALLLERAEVFESRLEDAESAADSYLSILEIDPAHQVALARIEELYEGLGAWDQLFAIKEHEADLAETEDEKIELLLTMAELARTRLGDPQRRTDALEKAYALRGEDLSIVEPLLDAYIENEDFDRAEPILDNLIETLRQERNMSELVRFQHLQGKLAEQKGDFDEARAAYEATHKVDATYIPNLLSLGKLLVRTDQWDDALKIFQTLLLHQMNIKDSHHKVELYYHLGQVRLHKGDERRAKDMFNRALGIDSDHQPSKDALAEL